VTGFSLLAVRVARLLHKPVLLKPATHGDLQNVFAGGAFKLRIYRRWIRQADCLIAISEEMKEEMLACGISEKQIRRIPNSVDTNRYVCASPERKATLRSRQGIPGGGLLFLYLGRLEERKGVDHLLRAWQRLQVGILWIVGSGPEEEKLKTISRDLKLRNVVFQGTTNAPLDFYQCADVLVFPSLREGSPNVLLEAMSCSLPCVATEIGGVTDLVHHDVDGFLVPPGSPEALAQAMEHAASHPADRKRWGEQAARLIRERFDVSRILAEYTDLYSELIKRC
jgi:glycosyltransferase involved in cell wall biosynthesis